MQLKTKTKSIKLPVFFPDATHGFVKSVGSADLIAENVQGLVINTFHAIADEKLDTINKVGGIHKFINFFEPIITDSGGFQAMSLIRRNPKNGKITDNGIIFKLETLNKKIELTPENCIETQLKIGSDIIMCLDDCTDPAEPLIEQEKSIKRTIDWANRCKKTFNKHGKSEEVRPLIFAIIQGGNDKDLRKECAEELKKIGFDGFAFGGWPMGEENGVRGFLKDIVGYTASLMPDDKPKYAMGVGKPEDIVEGIKMGYNMFDCVLPTRDARHKRLYIFDNISDATYKFLYISSSKYAEDTNPISDSCECHTCKNYSRAYIYHLFKIGDPLAYQLATIHNLRFYSDLMRKF